MEPAAAAILNAFVEDIKSAWKERSGAELRVRVAQVAEATTPPTKVHPDQLHLILERAAVSGSVLPLDLTAGMGLDNPEVALDALAHSFERAVIDGRWRWTLQSWLRGSALQRLYDSGRIDSLLGEVETVPTDEAGALLRSLLAERPPRPHQDAPRGMMDPAAVKQRQTELKLRIQALDWLSPLVSFKALLAGAQRESAAINQLVNSDRLLSRGFVGRKREMKRLFDFASARPIPASSIPILEVSGIGGAGKSTLLAKMIRNHALDRDANLPILVHLDLDRIAFQLGGVLELTFEVTRQIGIAHMPVADQLASLRRETRSQLAEFVEEGTESSRALEARLRAAHDFQQKAKRIIAEGGLAKRPIVLLLDTFEEWQRPQPRRAHYVGAWTRRLQEMHEWLSGLRDYMGLAGLRVIISGRAPIGFNDQLFDRQQPIHLGPLSPSDRMALLEQKYQFSEPEARKLSRIAGGNPLSLHLAARQLRTMPSEQRERFLDDTAPVSRHLREAVRQSILYNRFLDHVRDEDARKLAHPGLALRFVTPDLIRHLLAGPCGLGEVNEARAESLFALLEDEVWLVERCGDRLVHRPDVRRTMLRMMKADPAQAELVERVHLGAIDYYAGQTDPGAVVERRYHELMLMPRGANLEEIGLVTPGDAWREALPAYLKELSDAADDLPRRLAVQLRFLADYTAAPSDIRHFPAAYRRRVIEQIGLDYCRGGRADVAVGLLGLVAGPEPDWASEARIAAGRWGQRDARTTRAVFYGLDELQFASTPFKYLLIEQFLSETSHDWMWVRQMVGDALFSPKKTSVGSTSIESLYFLRVTDPDHRGGDACAGAVLEAWGSRFVQPSHPIAALRLVIAGAGLGRKFPPRPIDLRSILAPLILLDGADILRTVDLIRPELGPELESLLDEFGSDRHSSSVLLTEFPLVLQRLLLSAQWEMPIEHFVLGHARPDRDLPELRPAIRMALADAFPQAAGLAKLGEIALPLLPIRPIDFKPERLRRDGRRRPMETRSRLVEYVDRSGVMPQALDAWASARPKSALLQRVRDGRRRLAEACAELEARIRAAENA
jgi:hypothetical protein